MKKEDTALDKFIEKRSIEFEEGQGVELQICERTEIGYKTIINDARWGMLYKNEVFQTLRKGQVIPGFIKKVREDGKIDVCLHKPGPEKVDAMSEKVLEILKAQGGSINVSDSSSPEVIYRLFGVSKKTYKKAIGALYKKRLIVIEDDSIKLSAEKET
jgi:predicted RNA-binding protein (virulence factor B family)